MEQIGDRPRKFEFEPRLLALFLFISIPFILIGSLLILRSVRTEVNKTIGDNLAELAATNARYLDSYILTKVTDVSRLAVTPTLVDDVVAGNQRYPENNELAQKRIAEIDDDWQQAGGLTWFAVEILRKRSSQFLRDVASFSPAYQEILLTDERGALVAATNATTDYFQADEPWWQKAYGDGYAGTIHVSNVRYDTSARVYGMDVAVPIRVGEGDQERVAGVLKALIGAQDLFAVLDAVKVGGTGRAVLLNAPDETVITAENPTNVMKESHPGFVHLKEAVAQGRRHFISQHNDGSTWLTGFSRMPEPGHPEIAWYVVVEQLIEEAQASTQGATAYLLLFFGAMVLLVLIFSLYMHFRLVKPVREVDLREEMDRLSGAVSESKTG
jgi:hypothetical protein